METVKEVMSVKNTELVHLVEESQMERTKAQKVLDNFTEFFNEASVWESKVKDLVIADASQVAEMQMAREARLALKEVRVNAEKKKKELKENILIEGRFIDGIYNTVVAVTKPLENDLLEKEKFIERQEEKRLEDLRQKRESQLQGYEIDTTYFDLAAMPDEAFIQLLESSKIAYEKRVEDERKAEADRIAAEKAAAEEQKRIRLENERLKKEAEAREKELQKERERVEAERKAREKAEAEERARQEEVLRKEREEKEAILAEMKAKQEAEAKAKREREEREAAELRAKEEAEKAAALAPDKTKLISYCESVLAIDRPKLTMQETRELLDGFIQAVHTVKKRAQEIK